MIFDSKVIRSDDEDIEKTVHTYPSSIEPGYMAQLKLVDELMVVPGPDRLEGKEKLILLSEFEPAEFEPLPLPTDLQRLIYEYIYPAIVAMMRVSVRARKKFITSLPHALRVRLLAQLAPIYSDLFPLPSSCTPADIKRIQDHIAHQSSLVPDMPIIRIAAGQNHIITPNNCPDWSLGVHLGAITDNRREPVIHYSVDDKMQHVLEHPFQEYLPTYLQMLHIHIPFGVLTAFFRRFAVPSLYIITQTPPEMWRYFAHHQSAIYYHIHKLSPTSLDKIFVSAPLYFFHNMSDSKIYDTFYNRLCKLLDHKLIAPPSKPNPHTDATFDMIIGKRPPTNMYVDAMPRITDIPSSPVV